MEIILKQHVSYAKIKLYKNYSDRLLKTVIYDSDRFEDVPGDLDLTFESLAKMDDMGIVPINPTSERGAAKRIDPLKHTISIDANNWHKHNLVNLKLFKKSTANYFYTTDPKREFTRHDMIGRPIIKYDEVKLVNAKTVDKTRMHEDYFITTKDKQIKRHYNNPFAFIQIRTIERSIKKDGNKIKIKTYWHSKHRKLGGKFFKKTTDSTTVTFDMVTGNFTVVVYNSRTKNKKNFYTNSYGSLQRAIGTIFGVDVKEHPKEIQDSLIKEFDFFRFVSELFMVVLGKCFGVGNQFIALQRPNNPEEIFKMESIGSQVVPVDNIIKNFCDIWIYKFSDIKKIKLPDEPLMWLKYFYPTEKYLKKNDRKLIASILDRFGILSKLNVKLLHKYPHNTIETLLDLCDILGDNHSKYIGNIKEEFFSAEPAYTNPFINVRINSRMITKRVTHDFNFVTEKEKENMISVINDVDYTRSRNKEVFVDEIKDHFLMIRKLRKYYPNLKMRSRSERTFEDEHIYLSRLEGKIKKGYVLERIYDKEIIEEIERPIEVQRSELKDIDKTQVGWNVYTEVYYPHLLKTSDEYTEEGKSMHHCVGGYVDRKESMIVSLRHKSERVTCEFATRNKQPVQSRYSFNKKPPEHFNEALDILYERIKHIPFPILPRDIVRIPLIINGVEVQGEEESDDFMQLNMADRVWNDPLRLA